MLPLRTGQVERHTHDYKRNGTTSLFAAIDVATGHVTNATCERHTGEDFLGFLRLIARTYPTGELHVILDNVSTHKTPAVRAWLERHPRITFQTRTGHEAVPRARGEELAIGAVGGSETDAEATLGARPAEGILSRELIYVEGRSQEAFRILVRAFVDFLILSRPALDAGDNLARSHSAQSDHH